MLPKDEIILRGIQSAIIQVDALRNDVIDKKVKETLGLAFYVLKDAEDFAWEAMNRQPKEITDAKLVAFTVHQDEATGGFLFGGILYETSH